MSNVWKDKNAKTIILKELKSKEPELKIWLITLNLLSRQWFLVKEIKSLIKLELCENLNKNKMLKKIWKYLILDKTWAKILQKHIKKVMKQNALSLFKILLKLTHKIIVKLLMLIMFKIMKIVLNQKTFVFIAVFRNLDRKADKIEKNVSTNVLRMEMMAQLLLLFSDNHT